MPRYGRPAYESVAVRPSARSTGDSAALESATVKPVSAEIPFSDANPPQIDLAIADETAEVIERPSAGPELTLDSAIEMALRQNPSLVALRQDVPVSRAALCVARSYPHDPSVQVTVMPECRFRDGDQGSVVNSVQIMQTVEVAHQPRYRWQAGCAQLQRTGWNIVAAELQSVAETQRRFSSPCSTGASRTSYTVHWPT